MSVVTPRRDELPAPEGVPGMVGPQGEDTLRRLATERIHRLRGSRST